MQATTEQTAFVERRFNATPELDLYLRDYAAQIADPAVPMVCLHGYFRTCRDFDSLAEHVSQSRRVITPDMRGRGRSARSDNVADYELDRMVDDLIAMLAELGIDRAVMLGTVLGAHLAMLASVRRPDLVAGIVFNDSAPEVDQHGAAKAASFVGTEELTFDQALAKIRAQNEAGFTRYGDEDFIRMTNRAYWPTGNGTYLRDFDLRTSQVIPKVRADHPTFWPEFNAIQAPIAILRGENSDHMTNDMMERMKAAKPDAMAFTIPGCGHPPMLWEPESLAAVDAFLAKVDGTA